MFHVQQWPLLARKIVRKYHRKMIALPLFAALMALAGPVTADPPAAVASVESAVIEAQSGALVADDAMLTAAAAAGEDPAAAPLAERHWALMVDRARVCLALNELLDAAADSRRGGAVSLAGPYARAARVEWEACP